MLLVYANSGRCCCLVSPLFVVVTNLTQDPEDRQTLLSLGGGGLHTAAVAKVVYRTAFRRGVRLTIVPRRVWNHQGQRQT